MTLGCGGWGGNITSDNISPRHLLNIKRLAYELRPAQPSATMAKTAGTMARPAVAEKPARVNPLPKAPAAPEQRGIPAQVLAARIDEFLASRGYKAPGAEGGKASPKPLPNDPAAGPRGPAADFICEDDVRAALNAGRKLLIGERTIITPSARDLGESRRVFVQASWPT
jgi:acetaldehyde dehydrogenase (acetylating)